MDKLKAAIASVLALGLLAGLAIGVAGQDEAAGFAAPVEVTGTADIPANCNNTVIDGEPTLTTRQHIVFTCTAQLKMSDQRLNGDAGITYEQYVFDGSDLPIFKGCARDKTCEEPLLRLETGVLVIANEDGSWRQRPSANPFVGFPRAEAKSQLLVLDGIAGYEGLAALLQLTEKKNGRQIIRGFIIDGGFPPASASPATQ